MINNPLITKWFLDRINKMKITEQRTVYVLNVCCLLSCTSTCNMCTKCALISSGHEPVTLEKSAQFSTPYQYWVAYQKYKSSWVSSADSALAACGQLLSLKC